MLISIVVLSYNRPLQIERILKSLVGVKSMDINLIIKDDLSPKTNEIKELVNSYKDNLAIDLVYYCNAENLGYDRNLLDAFNITDSDYVFLLSDDDYVSGDKVEQLVSVVRKRSQKFYFTPYTDHTVNVVNRKFNGLSDIDVKLSDFSNVIYNSILFSGLVFHRETVLNLNLDREFLSNCIYTQVYLAGCIVYEEKSYGVIPDGVLHLGGDGENFFGKNSSAINSDVLSDRNKISSNLNYQQFLLAVVEKLSLSTEPAINNYFIKEYKKRLISYGLRARSYGLKTHLGFIKSYLNSKLPFFIIPFLSFVLVIMLPSKLSRSVNSMAKGIFRQAG
ncbi:glycosyltransferase family 2 protein [Yokenella regensburgei]|uniref:glycosyltransferase family 2 protein n=1 Tax=Yokenella regensburgei TaxID=158877 RepID=UPI003EDA63DA